MWNAFFQLLRIDYICDSFTLKLKSARKIEKTKNVEIDCIRHIKKSEPFKRLKRKRNQNDHSTELETILADRKSAKKSTHVLKWMLRARTECWRRMRCTRSFHHVTSSELWCTSKMIYLTRRDSHHQLWCTLKMIYLMRRDSHHQLWCTSKVVHITRRDSHQKLFTSSAYSSKVL